MPGPISVKIVERACACVGGTEVGTVATEHVDPLRPRVLEGVVGVEVGGVDGAALSAVDCGGVGQFHVMLGVGRRQDPVAAIARDRDVALVVDAGGGPVVSVGEVELPVVATGGDQGVGGVLAEQSGLIEGSGDRSDRLIRTDSELAAEKSARKRGVGSHAGETQTAPDPAFPQGRFSCCGR